MFCPKCGNRLDDSVRFCDKCGASIGDHANPSHESGNASSVGPTDTQRAKPRMSPLKVIIAGVATAVVAGGIAMAVSSASNGNKHESTGQQHSQEMTIREDPDSPANASLIVYSSYGTQMSEYDITLINESGDSLAYHVDHAWGGFLLSDLGVGDGTYDVIVTDQHSGDSATVDDVIVNAGAKGIATYEVGSEGEERSSEAWSYMDTATNRLEAANLFWEQCQELQTKYGEPSTFTDAEFNFVYPTGLCFVDLLDVNEDGEDEMVVCYIDKSVLEENIANRSPYGSTIKDPGWIQVFQYNRRYHDLYNELATATGISAGKGAIGFTHDVPVGVGLVKCDLNKGRYERYDLTGEHFEGKLYSDYGVFDYYRDGEEVGPTEATQGIQDLLSNCTLYHLCGDIDPSLPAEVLPYTEVERVTKETLDYLSHADEILFQNPKKNS